MECAIISVVECKAMRVSLGTWPCYFLLGGDLASCLRTTGHLPGYLHWQGRWTPFLYHEWSCAFLKRYLTRLFRQDCAFFLLGPANDRFHATDVQHDLAIPSLALLAPPVSSPMS